MTRSWRAASAALLALLACQDAARVAGPAMLPPAASVTPADDIYMLDDGPIPRVPDESQIPSDWCMPRIDGLFAHVYWKADTATYFGRLDYCGNRARLTIELKVTGPGGQTSGPGPLVFQQSHLEPNMHTLHTGGLKWVVAKSCGHTANVSLTAEVRFLLFVDWKGVTELFPAMKVATAGASQPPCACEDTSVIEDVGYGSPDDGGAGGGCGGDGGGSPKQGSGIQFAPGDRTGGETIDWETGIGNGGSSACGADAVVEYVCIDVWNEEAGRWEEWMCGYATTC